MANFFRTLDGSIQRCSSSGDVASLSVLERLRFYVSSGEFSSYSRAKELISVNSLSWKDASVVLGIKPDTVKRARYTVSQELWGIVGEDFFDRLSSGDLSYCMSIVDSLYADDTLTLVSPSIGDFLRSLATPDDLSLAGVFSDLDDYKEELAFLASISEPVIRARASNLDISKIIVLLDVLNGTLGNVAVRSRINDYILGSAEDLL